MKKSIALLIDLSLAIIVFGFFISIIMSGELLILLIFSFIIMSTVDRYLTSRKNYLNS